MDDAEFLERLATLIHGSEGNFIPISLEQQFESVGGRLSLFYRTLNNNNSTTNKLKCTYQDMTSSLPLPF